MSETGEVVYRRTYSRVKPDGTHEEWPETVQRVVDGNLALVDERYQIEHEREDLLRMMEEFKILPAGRHLWASGVKNAQHLFNCFHGDTLVHTDQGVLPIRELSGGTFNTLSEGGVYRPAEFNSYGEQELLEVTLKSGEQFLATPDHSWVTWNSGRFYRHPTSALEGKRLPYNSAPPPEINDDYWEGVAHGIVYGDGSKSGNISTMVHLFGEKEGLAKYLVSNPTRWTFSVSRHEDRIYVGRLPGHWKDLPKGVSRSYARGFIVGLIATDGYAKRGTVHINQSTHAEEIAALATWAGFVVGRIAVDRVVSPFTGQDAPSYRIPIRGWSLDPQRDLLRPLHRERFGKAQEVESPRTVSVVSVRHTGRFEEVYCAVEPETHTITVGSGILTGQCWVSGWTDTPSDHFHFTFMRLMEGGGVGANYSNRFLKDYPPIQQELYVHIVCDPEHPDYEAMRDAGVLSMEYDPDWMGAFVIEDSREGWAAALVDLIDTHYRDEVSYFQRVYDVSRVRAAGARLKTFGGKASGPLPLARMLIDVCEILSKLAHDNQPLDGIAAMAIDHAIAQCVVAGGVRRSARMAMMHWADPQIEEFLTCKQDTESHWTTNISVEVDDQFWEDVRNLDQNQTHVSGQQARRVLEAISEGMVNNGEPGFWDSSLSNIGEPNRVVCTNPCLTGDTVIATINGPRTFADLAESGEDVEVYSWHPETKTPVVRWMRRPHKTRENAEILKVTFDSGLVVRCTPDHSFYTFHGKKVQAQDLQPGKSIRAFSASFDGSGHELDNGFHNRKRETACANHKVVSVEPAGYADVYNGMVEDSHTYIVLDPEPVAGHMSGIVSANCGEITLEPWEPCNLGHINLAAFVKDNGKVDMLELIKAHRLMTRFLIRATFSPVADPKSREVLDRNRRIGVGHLGVASFLALTNRRYSQAPSDRRSVGFLRDLAKEVDRAAGEFCHELRIPVPVKKRTVAPTGTISKMPGVSEGIHPIFSKYFNRRIRFSTNDPEQVAQMQALADQGYTIENDLYAANTSVVTIPTKDWLVQAVVDKYGRDAEDIVEAANDLTLEQMLAFQALYQEYWADNAVSFTANVDPGQYEPLDVARLLIRFGGRLKGATIFPSQSRPQAPYERITKQEYERATARDVSDGVDEECAGGACPIR